MSWSSTPSPLLRGGGFAFRQRVLPFTDFVKPALDLERDITVLLGWPQFAFCDGFAQGKRQNATRFRRFDHIRDVTVLRRQIGRSEFGAVFGRQLRSLRLAVFSFGQLLAVENVDGA